MKAYQCEYFKKFFSSKSNPFTDPKHCMFSKEIFANLMSWQRIPCLTGAIEKDQG
jgi:hypothetical protein